MQLTEANKILENGILSKNEKATFTGVSTIVSFIETQQEAIQPASMQFLFKRSQVASYNALLCRCHEVTQTIAEHQIKVVQQIASIEGILSDPHSPAITMMSQNPYAYVNVLTDALKNMRACRYEASVLYASDKKLIFDINTIVDDLGMLVEQIHTTITLVTSLRPEWIDYLQRNGIDVNSAYPFDPKLIELVEAFLKEKTPYGKTQLLADEILKIIRSDEFKERLNFSNNKSDSATK